MSKEGAKINKICSVKKINKMNKAECESELARLVNDSSKYKDHVKERLASL